MSKQGYGKKVRLLFSVRKALRRKHKNLCSNREKKRGHLGEETSLLLVQRFGERLAQVDNDRKGDSGKLIQDF